MARGAHGTDTELHALRARVAALERELADAQRESTEHLRQQHLYRSLIELVPDAMLVHDGARKIVYINPAGVRLFGADSADQILGTLVTDYVHPESRRLAAEGIASVFAGDRTVVRLEQRRLRLDGSEYYADLSVSPITWAGSPAVLAVVRDVTERREARARYEEAEAARHEVHQRLLDAVEAMNEGFALFDAEDRLQIYNRRYVDDIWPGCEGSIRPGVTFSEIVEGAIERGVWRGADEPEDEIVRRIFDRHRNLPSESEISYPSGRWLRQSKKRTREGGVVAVYSDITEIKESELRHRQLLEALPDAIVIHIDDRIVYANPAAVRLVGANSADDLIGRHSRATIPPEFHQLQRERRDKVLRDRRTVPPIEQMRIRRDGSTVAVETVATFILWEGRPAFLGVLRDITERKEAEAALAESERRFRAVTDHIPGAVFQRVLTPDGKVRFPYISAGIRNVSGIDAEDIMCDATPFNLRVRRDFQETYSERLRQSAADLTPLDIDIPTTDANGKTIWLRSKGLPHRLPDGSTVWDGLVIDITDFKQVEEEARQSHRWLVDAINAMSSGFMLWNADDRLVLWNQHIADFHPDPTVFREGISFEEVVAGPYQLVRQTEGDEAADRWLEERRRQHRDASGAHQFRGKDGRYLVITERRTPEGFVVTLITDVTEREETEQRYRALIDLSPDAIYVHDGGGIVVCNRAAVEMFGATSQGDLIGCNTIRLTHPEFHDIVRERRRQVVSAGQQTVSMRQLRLKLDGTPFWAEVAASRIDWSGRPGGIVVLRDVARQMEAEAQLVQSKEEAELANRAKTEFLANISHELRTPLNAIIGFSDLMQREMFGPLGSPQYRDYATDIYQSGSHLHDVINDILDLSKIEAGKLELHEEHVAITPIVERCFRLVAARAREGFITLISEIPESLPMVRADERKLKQILINLLSNAVKFTPPHGKITVSAGVDGAGLSIAVVDTGVGMKPAEIDRAMTPFGQLDGNLNRRHEGTGLGLPLTKSLVELHDGTLEIDSRPDKGTRVTIRLPAERLQPASSAAE